ncbi:MAG: pantetheine-phosphate adenylyltransferase [Tissierellia bacterium]|nr:pantetheine-phosphate adenylyltransferase [Tissierellia bacterium]
MKIAVYPGSFDPVTNGHLDIIKRAASLCEELYVAVLENPVKNSLFTIEERVSMLQEALKEFDNVKVEPFRGLLIDYVKQTGAQLIIRGLRAVSDYEYELQMALANKKLDPEIETVFLVANTEYSFLSSSLVKELAAFKGELNELVPSCVKHKLQEKMKER